MDVNDEEGNPVSVATGAFTIYHDNYVEEAKEYKYCIVCNHNKANVKIVLTMRNYAQI